MQQEMLHPRIILAVDGDLPHVHLPLAARSTVRYHCSLTQFTNSLTVHLLGRYNNQARPPFSMNLRIMASCPLGEHEAIKYQRGTDTHSDLMTVSDFIRSISLHNQVYGYVRGQAGGPLRRQAIPALIPPLMLHDYTINMLVALLQTQLPLALAPGGAAVLMAGGAGGGGGGGGQRPRQRRQGGAGGGAGPGPGGRGGQGQGQGGGGGGRGGQNGARQQSRAVEGGGDNRVDDDGNVAGGRVRARSISVISLSDDDEAPPMTASTPKGMFFFHSALPNQRFLFTDPKTMDLSRWKSTPREIEELYTSSSDSESEEQLGGKRSSIWAPLVLRQVSDYSYLASLITPSTRRRTNTSTPATLPPPTPQTAGSASRKRPLISTIPSTPSKRQKLTHTPPRIDLAQRLRQNVDGPSRKGVKRLS
jgi:hypothetical protein